MSVLGDTDLRQLEARGMKAEEGERQLGLLREPPPAVALVRPCAPGDGIEVLGEDRLPELFERHEAAARQGRFLKFVPASGAASRMFSDLAWFCGRSITRAEVEALARGGHPQACGLSTFLEGLPRFPFWEDLRHVLGDRPHEVPDILDALLSEDGLDYARFPKGLIPFHRYGDESRTAFEEHLVEGAHYTRDARGTCRLHLTVSSEHEELFEDALRSNRAGYESSYGMRLEVAFSLQKASTDTVALAEDGRPFRTDEGSLLLRPGGHGALIENLSDLRADLVYVKNIDNVVPDRLKGPTYTWKRALAGRLLELQREAFDHLRLLRSGQAAPAIARRAEAFCRGALHASPGADAASLMDRLDRPLRVCGVVRNTGEPGGGPFWVREPDGSLGLQIVEGAQVDPNDLSQRAVYESSTHFSPTDLVCSLRDDRGQPYDLRRFVDPNAVILARKTYQGRSLMALERPGLWNGGMARWNTVFVEVPLETFNPVKTVNDLLRPEHQP